jgi:bifunctional UDP-N-acetylglucosamine pyrophosphorylase/glucosamine-1-phosphate N-acetyltransferase
VKGVAVIVLAGGLGTRMKSGPPKVLQPLLGKPMISYPVEAALALKPERVIIVRGANGGDLENALVSYKDKISFAVQKKPLGTGDAFRAGLAGLKGFKGRVLVINADSPLITSSTLKGLLNAHLRDKNSLSLASFIAQEPGAFGRIFRDKKKEPVKIIEKTDLAPDSPEIREVNSGIYVFEKKATLLSEKIKRNRKKGEFYLTDILGIAVRSGLKAGVYPLAGEEEFAGVNTYAELEQAERILRARIINALMLKGVRFIEPRSAFIHPSVKVAPGAVIYPNVHIEGNSAIGKDCVIYPNSRVVDSIIKEGAIVKDSSIIETSIIEKKAQVGPFAHLRPGAHIKENARIGNFVEVKNSRIGKGTKALHLSYIGDSEVGRGVNIGAGTITCNYDGVNKHRTIIEDHVFIGSDTQLIAPVKVEKGSYVGAGSTIRKDVPKGSLAVSRAEQKHIKDWAKKAKKKK